MTHFSLQTNSIISSNSMNTDMHVYILFNPDIMSINTFKLIEALQSIKISKFQKVPNTKV